MWLLRWPGVTRELGHSWKRWIIEGFVDCCPLRPLLSLLRDAGKTSAYTVNRLQLMHTVLPFTQGPWKITWLQGQLWTDRVRTLQILCPCQGKSNTNIASRRWWKMILEAETGETWWLNPVRVSTQRLTRASLHQCWDRRLCTFLCKMGTHPPQAALQPVGGDNFCLCRLFS